MNIFKCGPCTPCGPCGSTGNVQAPKPTAKKTAVPTSTTTPAVKATEAKTSQAVTPLVKAPSPTPTTTLVGPAQQPAPVVAPVQQPVQKQEPEVVKEQVTTSTEPTTVAAEQIEAAVPFKPGKIELSKQVEQAFTSFINRKAPVQTQAPAPVVQQTEVKAPVVTEVKETEVKATVEEEVKPATEEEGETSVGVESPIIEVPAETLQKMQEELEVEAFKAKQKQSFLQATGNIAKATVNGVASVTVGTVRTVKEAVTDPFAFTTGVFALGLVGAWNLFPIFADSIGQWKE